MVHHLAKLFDFWKHLETFSTAVAALPPDGNIRLKLASPSKYKHEVYFIPTIEVVKNS